MSADEIRDELKIKRYPRSTIYSALSQLEKAGWITSSRPILPWGRPTKEIQARFGRDKARRGRPRKVYRAHLLWKFGIDPDFLESLEPILDKHAQELNQTWIKIIDAINDEYRTNENLKEFYPRPIICPECGLSHEALEFFAAMSIGIVDNINRKKAFQELMEKSGFAVKED